jgi:ketosteroid isomerase-like protein
MRSTTSRTDVVRRFYAAFTERDLPALLDTLDPDIDFRPVLGILYPQNVYRGAEEITRWYEGLAGEWDAFEAIVENAIEAGDGVVAFVHLAAHRGEQRLEAEIAVECRFTGDRISSFVGRDAWDVAEELGVPGPSDGGSYR